MTRGAESAGPVLHPSIIAAPRCVRGFRQGSAIRVCWMPVPAGGGRGARAVAVLDPDKAGVVARISLRGKSPFRAGRATDRIRLLYLRRGGRAGSVPGACGAAAFVGWGRSKRNPTRASRATTGEKPYLQHELALGKSRRFGQCPHQKRLCFRLGVDDRQQVAVGAVHMPYRDKPGMGGQPAGCRKARIEMPEQAFRQVAGRQELLWSGVERERRLGEAFGEPGHGFGGQQDRRRRDLQIEPEPEPRRCQHARQCPS